MATLTISKRTRCIVPLTSFTEYSYWGQQPGHKLEFTPQDESILGVAGILNHHTRGSEDILSMTMLTRPASGHIMDWGLHRQPLFLDPSGYDNWLGDERDYADCRSVLRAHAIKPDFDVEVGNEMKAGWQKRVDVAIVKRDDQLFEIKKCGALGTG